MLDKIEALADTLVKNGGSKLRIAFNEDDDSTKTELEAQRFLKLDEIRLGRDFQLYSFMSDVEGKEATVVRLLEELVLPLEKTAPESYKAGLTALRAEGSVFGKMQSEWESMLDSMQPA